MVIFHRRPRRHAAGSATLSRSRTSPGMPSSAPRPSPGMPASETPDLPCRVGWREWITLSAAPTIPIKVKVDTGARTSALHATGVRSAGDGLLRFTVHPHQRRDGDEMVLVAPLVDHREVRSSSGSVEPRPTVRLEVELGPHRWPVEVTLTRRDSMGFRMLLGRTALRGRFLVDPGASFLLGSPLPSPRTGTLE